jgi:hypothetical protein
MISTTSLEKYNDVNRFDYVKVESLIADLFNFPVLELVTNVNREESLLLTLDDDKDEEGNIYMQYLAIFSPTLKDFMNMKISLLELMKNATELFVVYDFFTRAKGRWERYKIKFEDIPEDHLPTSDSILE